MKRCVRCSIAKPVADFRAMPKMRDGLDSWCIACHREYGREYARRRWVESAPARAQAIGERRAQRAAARAIAAPGPSVQIHYRTCQACHALFVGRRRDARYCSRRCQPSYTARHEEQRARREQVRANGRCCDHCGTWYQSGGRRFCSLRCGVLFWRVDTNAKRRARKRGAYVEHVYRRRVFERDDWTCWLCGTSIVRGVDRNHPLSATIDHVVPLARGGSHCYSNVRTAHRACNMAKGARLVAAA